VVRRGREADIERIFETWDLTSAVIGEVTDDGHLTVVDHKEQVARLPIQLLTEGAPLRRLIGLPPEPAPALDLDALAPPADTGAQPLAITDCLNMANPDRPEVYWQLEETVNGLAQACRSLDLPIVSGNVSLYNESAGGAAIYPTPVIGMIGQIDDYDRRLQAGFKHEGDFVLLIGSSHNDLGGSEYLKVEHGLVAGRP